MQIKPGDPKLFLIEPRHAIAIKFYVFYCMNQVLTLGYHWVDYVEVWKKEFMAM